MKRMLVPVLVAGLAIVAGQGCRRKADTDTPVATPAFSVSHRRAPLGSPVEATYRFTVAPSARFDGDYRVFVHFLDSSDEQMWTDDHDPPVPTSRWAPGQTVEYKRLMFIPRYPYLGEATVRLGLYAPKTGRRLPLAGDNDGQRAYKVGTIQLLPQSENVFLIFKDGWHAAEVSRDNASVEWQWTKRNATISFRNPKRDATLYLHLDGRPDLFGKPQHVTVSVGDQAVGTVTVDTKNDIIRTFPLTAAQLGSGDVVDLRLAVDQTFVPAQMPASQSRDPRELGVRVFHVFVEPH